MKIALLSDGVFPFVVGGMQKHSYYLAKHLAQAKVSVDLYFTYPRALQEKPDVNQLFTPEEQRYIQITSVGWSPKYRFPGHYVWESFLNSERIWEVLQDRLDVDFIYAQGFSGWKAMLAKRDLKGMPPVGVNFHGLEMWQKPASMKVRMEQWMLRPFVKANLELADVVLLLGEKLVPLADVVHKGQKKAIESANGVTEDWLVEREASNSKTIKFVFLGRYERRKGIEELQETIGRLLPQYDFSVDIIGPIPAGMRIKSDRVKYWGLIQDEARVRKILSTGDVLVCPSYAEGMPTVILEAMASGLAVIATDVGAVGDLVSEENGWIIPPGHQGALQSAMIAAITGTEDQLSSKRSASFSRVRNKYLWHRVAEKTIQGIESVL
ncbi:MAG: glycosyltransferase family 4 protein [Rhodothermales bacterium]